MAFVPPNGTHWILCEWRLFISPECPYEEGISQMYLAMLIMSCLLFAVLSVILVIRWRIWGLSPLRKDNFVWWLRPTPTETVFYAAWFMLIFRVVHSALILYARDTVPLFLLHYLYSMGHVLAVTCICYYWVSIVAALPTDYIVEDNSVVKGIMSFNIKLAFLVALFLQPLPYLEGVSGYFTLTNLPVANQLLTATYALYFTVFSVTAIMLTYFGRRIMKMFTDSIDFHNSRSIKDKNLIRQLRKSVTTIKTITTISSTILNGGAGSCIILAFARYYVWSVEGWSLFFHFAVTVFPTITGAFLVLTIFFRDVYLRHKYGPLFEGHHSTKDDSSTAHPEKQLTQKAPKDDDKTADEVRLEVISKAGQPDDAVMDEFMKSRS